MPVKGQKSDDGQWVIKLKLLDVYQVYPDKDGNLEKNYTADLSKAAVFNNYQKSKFQLNSDEEWLILTMSDQEKWWLKENEKSGKTQDELHKEYKKLYVRKGGEIASASFIAHGIRESAKLIRS